MGKRVLTMGIFTTSSQAGRYRLSGALQYVAAHPDIQPVIVTVPFRNKAVVRQTLDKRPLDGLLVWSTVALEALDRTPPDIPVVSVLGPRTVKSLTVDAIFDLDEREIVRAAADLALRRGHQNFAYVPSVRPGERMRSDLRGRLFSDFIGEAGRLCIVPDAMPGSDKSVTDTTAGLVRWLSGLPNPCLVLAYCDNRAYAVINACRSAGISVPGQVNVIGIDNETAICENVRPTITSVWPDFEGCGFRAAKTLHRFILNGRPKRTLHRACGCKDVVERASTIDMRGGGMIVSRVKELLRCEFADPKLSIVNIAKRLHVSRQLLDLRCREILGHSVHDELTSLRIAAAKRLLTRGDMSVDEIVRSCGYNSANAFRYAFRSATGCTPKSWQEHG